MADDCGKGWISRSLLYFWFEGLEGSEVLTWWVTKHASLTNGQRGRTGGLHGTVMAKVWQEGHRIEAGTPNDSEKGLDHTGAFITESFRSSFCTIYANAICFKVLHSLSGRYSCLIIRPSHSLALLFLICCQISIFSSWQPQNMYFLVYFN
jgi:hypothetical protein